jgi:Bacteriocin-protection, YdeI or OmpD-Associated/Domain of unknown function (DUF1905)
MAIPKEAALETQAFTAELVLLAVSFNFHCVVVPPSIAGPIHAAGHKRVVGTVQGAPYRMMLHRSKGISYVRVGAALRATVGAQPGDLLQVTIAPDPNPDLVDLPEALEAALAQTEGALQHFLALPPGTQRSLTHWVASSKREETQIQRSLELATIAAQGAASLQAWLKRTKK